MDQLVGQDKLRPHIGKAEQAATFIGPGQGINTKAVYRDLGRRGMGALEEAAGYHGAGPHFNGSPSLAVESDAGRPRRPSIRRMVHGYHGLALAPRLWSSGCQYNPAGQEAEVFRDCDCAKF